MKLAMWVLAFLFPLQALAGVPLSNTPITVANTTALQALPILAAAGGLVVRTTDGVSYTPSNAACSISGGDGITQIPSADGNCWLATNAQTGNFYAPSAKINRTADRFFAGGAVKASGANPATGTWVDTVLTGVYTYLERIGSFLSYSQTGQIAQFSAARTSDDTTCASSCVTIPSATFLYNDNTTVPQFAWGSYHTAVRASGAGGITNTEWDIGNLGSVVSVNPYSFPVAGMTANLWVGCGGELASTSLAGSLNPCSLAMGVLNNGQTYDKGIVIGSTALTSHGGSYYAINLATSDLIRWSNSATDVADAYINSSVTNDADANGLAFTNFGPLFVGPSGETQFEIALVPGSSSFPEVASSNTGIATFAARTTSGTGDVGLRLSPQNNGWVSANGSPIVLSPMTTAYLNAHWTCSSTTEGMMVAITDANSATFNAILAGGGTNHIIGYCNSFNFVVH